MRWLNLLLGVKMNSSCGAKTQPLYVLEQKDAE